MRGASILDEASPDEDKTPVIFIDSDADENNQFDAKQEPEEDSHESQGDFNFAFMSGSPSGPDAVEQLSDMKSNLNSNTGAENANTCDVEIASQAVAAQLDTGLDVAAVDIATVEVAAHDSVTGAAASSGHTTARSAGYKSKKVHSSPDDILRPISPYPACSIRLNFNDHRFTGQWRSDVSSEFWIDELANKSFSKKFTPETWKDSLRKVHEHVWTKWQLASDTEPALALQAGRSPPEPGFVPDSVFEALQTIIDTMPPEKKYARR